MFSSVLQPYIDHQITLLAPYVKQSTKLLDFGCGDLSLDQALVRHNSALRITGIDVVDFDTPKTKRVNFLKYDGVTIPFPDKTFDTVLIYHVFHHTPDPAHAFCECMRVCSRDILIIEPVLRYPLEKYGFLMLDILTNCWKSKAISIPDTIRTDRWWLTQFKKHHVTLEETRVVSFLPSWLPIGETRLYFVKK